MLVAQLAAPGMRSIIVVMLAGEECGFMVDLAFLEAMTQITANKTLDRTFYMSFRSFRKALFLVGPPGKIGNWETNYFFVEMNKYSVPKSVLLMRTDWARSVGRLF